MTNAPTILDRGSALVAEIMRTRWAPLDQARFDQALAECDLEGWSRAIRFHGIAGLLFWYHDDLMQALLPPDFYQRASGLHDRLRLKALTQTGVLKTVLQSLAAAQMTAVPLKGGALSAQIYGDFAVRLAGDLDVLVDEVDFDHAVELLVDQGWQRRPDYDLTDIVLRQRALRYLRHVRLVDADGHTLELHWRTAATNARSVPSLHQITAQLGQTDCHGLTFKTLPDDLLLQLIAHHSASSMVGRLKWGFDVIDLMAARPVPGSLQPAVNRSVNAVVQIMAHYLRLDPAALVPEGTALFGGLSGRLAPHVQREEQLRLFLQRNPAAGRRSFVSGLVFRLYRTLYYASLHDLSDLPAYIRGEVGRWLWTDAPAGKPVASITDSLRGRIKKLRG